MNTIRFTPGGFTPGHQYYAELLYNNVVVNNIQNLQENVEQSFTVSLAGTYILRVRSAVDGACVFTQTIQALFPVVSYTESAVDCNNNTYSYIITLTNPSTAGNNLQYGWSLLNDCSTVTNWAGSNNLILPADDVQRWVFVRNTACCNLISPSSKSPCVVCSLSVTNISFSCG